MQERIIRPTFSMAFHVRKVTWTGDESMVAAWSAADSERQQEMPLKKGKKKVAHTPRNAGLTQKLVPNRKLKERLGRKHQKDRKA